MTIREKGQGASAWSSPLAKRNTFLALRVFCILFRAISFEAVRTRAMTSHTTPTPPTQHCVECLREFPASQLMPLESGSVCAACKPVAVAKLKSGQPVGTIWRKGSRLVTLRGEEIEFPARCVQCNQSVEGFWMSPELDLGKIRLAPVGSGLSYLGLGLMSLNWVLPSVASSTSWPLLFASGGAMVCGMLLDKIPSAQPPIRWSYTLCPLHRREGWHERNGWWFTLAGIALAVMVGSWVPWEWASLVVIAVWLPIALFLSWGGVSCSSCTEKHVFFKGCGKEFLAGFPEWQGP
jgi:hypothetical protein